MIFAKFYYQMGPYASRPSISFSNNICLCYYLISAWHQKLVSWCWRKPLTFFLVLSIRKKIIVFVALWDDRSLHDVCQTRKFQRYLWGLNVRTKIKKKTSWIWRMRLNTTTFRWMTCNLILVLPFLSLMSTEIFRWMN